jgi:hypothetical protein
VVWAVVLGVAVLSIAGALGFILVKGGDGKSDTVAEGDTSTSASTTSTTSVTSDTTEATAGGSDGSAGTFAQRVADGYPAEANAAMDAEIRSMLYEWHTDIGAGRESEAWNLLTNRKRAQIRAEDGQSAWWKAQSDFGSKLAVSGLDVDIDVLEGDGVVRVMVSGMVWNGCEWKGLTWVRYEGGQWHYDPGYSVTPEREREWKPRVGELLGSSC